MAERRVGSAVFRFNLAPHLAIFRLVPQKGDAFPHYTAGQYIALRRENCRLTKKIARPDGTFEYAADMDENGNVRRGPVTHSYSISSAPFETEHEGWLEFYVILELDELGQPGRLTESLFLVDPGEDDKIIYYTKIAGEFTLGKLAKGFHNVVFVGTGTGLAPFASMLKQLNHDALLGRTTDTRYTLFHANRTARELGYHATLHAIQEGGKIDFLYVPTVSRPVASDNHDPHVGRGRASNVLRYAYDLPMREEELLREAGGNGEARTRAQAALDRIVSPQLPSHVSKEGLRKRLDPGSTIILTCGNPKAMEDIKRVAALAGVRFEKEEW